MQQINIALPKKYRPRITSKRRKSLFASKNGLFSRRQRGDIPSNRQSKIGKIVNADASCKLFGRV